MSYFRNFMRLTDPSVEVVIEYRVDPVSPGSYFEPPEPGEVEILKATIVDTDTAVELTTAEADHFCAEIYSTHGEETLELDLDPAIYDDDPF